MKILFLASAYTRQEAFASVCNAFEALGHAVTYYPLYMRTHDYTEEVRKGIQADELTIKRIAMPKMWDEILRLAAVHDLALVWKAEMLPISVLQTVSELVRTVYYSWDDPYQAEVDPTAIGRAVTCHVSATCCEATAARYTLAKGKGVWVPVGYDPAVHFDEAPPEVDVCFIATNTYCKEIYAKVATPPFDRRDLVRAVLEVTKSVELWGRGDDVLGWLHKDHGDPSFAPYFKGFIKFEEARKAFSRARICVNSHVRRTGRKYFNERTFQILGCRRAQLIDRNPGTEEILGSAVMTYDSVAELKDGVKRLLEDAPARHQMVAWGYKLAEKYTWQDFCTRILEAAR